MKYPRLFCAEGRHILLRPRVKSFYFFINYTTNRLFCQVFFKAAAVPPARHENCELYSVA